MEVKKFIKHLRGENEDSDARGTLCVLYDEEADKFSAGAALCHELDRERFSRKLGRTIAEGRARSKMRNPDRIITPFRSFGSMVEIVEEKLFFPRTEDLPLPGSPEKVLKIESAYQNWLAVQEELEKFSSAVIELVRRKQQEETQIAG